MGTATFNIQPIDPLTGQRLTPYTFQTNVEAIIQNPVVANGTIENNPFNLTITSDSELGLSFLSASSLRVDPLRNDNYLAQYWQIDLNNQTGEFQGTLIEDHTEIAAAYNFLILPSVIAEGVGGGISIPLPGNILEGAQISGVVSQTDFQATIIGNTNQFDSFTIGIEDTLF